MDEDSLQEFDGDIKGVIPVDNRNNDLHFIPMMENIISFHDIDWYIRGDVRMAYNVLSKVYDVKLLCTGLYFDIMPYADSYYHPEEGPL